VKSRILRGRRALRELLDPLLHAERTAVIAPQESSAAERTTGAPDLKNTSLPNLAPAPALAFDALPNLAALRSRGGAR
jgi:hypothetical protein